MACEGPADDGPPPRIEAPLEEAPDSIDTTPSTAVPAVEEAEAFEQLSFEGQVAKLSAESPAFREAIQRIERVDGPPAGFVRARVTAPSGEKECNRPPSTDEASTLSRGGTNPFAGAVTDPTPRSTSSRVSPTFGPEILRTGHRRSRARTCLSPCQSPPIHPER